MASLAFLPITDHYARTTVTTDHYALTTACRRSFHRTGAQHRREAIIRPLAKCDQPKALFTACKREGGGSIGCLHF